MYTPQLENKMLNADNLISVKKYADARRITLPAVYNAIKRGWQLPGVQEVVKVDGITMLLLSDRKDFCNDSAK